MDLSLFDFCLPEGFIAYYPARRRDGSKLMVLNRQTGEIRHKKFPDIVDYLNPGDGLIINNTKVFKARLFCHRPTGGKVELFLLEEINYEGETCWQVLAHPTRRIKEGELLSFDDHFSIKVV
ncbi:MAG: S-adenosylmethionine:tRNA ribosyltransferase-isomerase, partial [candidate division Zixibacteria bacterium]|nr:S-adenosylmethionine:tRNA ribosyltransferase-isomerase [candidate division Zixibacteria bacterium]